MPRKIALALAELARSLAFLTNISTALTINQLTHTD